jgi:hypothetical protein
LLVAAVVVDQVVQAQEIKVVAVAAPTEKMVTVHMTVRQHLAAEAEHSLQVALQQEEILEQHCRAAHLA